MGVLLATIVSVDDSGAKSRMHVRVRTSAVPLIFAVLPFRLVPPIVPFDVPYRIDAGMAHVHSILPARH